MRRYEEPLTPQYRLAQWLNVIVLTMFLGGAFCIGFGYWCFATTLSAPWDAVEDARHRAWVVVGLFSIIVSVPVFFYADHLGRSTVRSIDLPY